MIPAAINEEAPIAEDPISGSCVVVSPGELSREPVQRPLAARAFFCLKTTQYQQQCTYARTYARLVESCLRRLIGLPTHDDDDGERKRSVVRGCDTKFVVIKCIVERR